LRKTGWRTILKASRETPNGPRARKESEQGQRQSLANPLTLSTNNKQEQSKEVTAMATDEKKAEDTILQDTPEFTEYQTDVEVGIKGDDDKVVKYQGKGSYKIYKTDAAAAKAMNVYNPDGTVKENVVLQYANAYGKNLSLQAARNSLHVAHGTRTGKAKFDVPELVKGMMAQFGCTEEVARSIMAGAKK